MAGSDEAGGYGDDGGSSAEIGKGPHKMVKSARSFLSLSSEDLAQFYSLVTLVFLLCFLKYVFPVVSSVCKFPFYLFALRHVVFWRVKKVVEPPNSVFISGLFCKTGIPSTLSAFNTSRAHSL